jgi:hypothetical protein
MPKAITKEVTLYTFRELVELEKAGTMRKACEKAREWLQEGATDFDWWDGVYETWTSALEQIGFNSPEISFSGFWSQGDGASFTCKSVDMDKLIDFLLSETQPTTVISYDGKTEDFRGWLLHKIGGKQKANPEFSNLIGKVVGEVTRISHHYSHYNTCDFGLDEDDSKFFESVANQTLANELGTACEKLREDLCRAIYKDLETEYEWRNADEQLIDDADANEWLFNKNGAMESV